MQEKKHIKKTKGDEVIYKNQEYFYNDYADIIYDEKIEIWSLGLLHIFICSIIS